MNQNVILKLCFVLLFYDIFIYIIFSQTIILAVLDLTHLDFILSQCSDKPSRQQV